MELFDIFIVTEYRSVRNSKKKENDIRQIFGNVEKNKKAIEIRRKIVYN